MGQAEKIMIAAEAVLDALSTPIRGKPGVYVKNRQHSLKILAAAFTVLFEREVGALKQIRANIVDVILMALVAP